MLADYLRRGVKAGLVAGVAFGLLLALVANPLVAFADGYGHAAAGDGGHAHGAHDGHDAGVSAAVASFASALGGVLWGVLLGGVVFGAGFFFLEPSIPGTGDAKSYLLAAAGFVTVSGAPWLVLPPQPPGAESALPIGVRTAWYGGMMAVGALTCGIAGHVYGRVRGERRRAVAAAAGVLPFVLLAVPVAVAPATPVRNPLPPALAAGVTGVTVFGQMTLWAVLAAAHARLRRRAGRRTAPAGDAAERAVATAD